MLKHIEWIKNSKNKYDINNTFNKILQDKHNKYITKIKNDLKSGKLTLSYDKDILTVKLNNKEIFSCKYLNIGLYNKENSVWYWSWNIPYISKTLSLSEKNILPFKTLLDVKYDKFKPHEVDEYYFYLNNGNFYIQHDDISKLIALVIGLNNCESFIEITNESVIEYILITNIIKIK